MARSHLVCYAAGAPVHALNRARLVASAHRVGIDHVYPFGPEAIDAAFLEAHRAVLDAGVGAGAWLWKPYLIDQTMRRTAPGDIVLYADAGAFMRQSPAPIWESNPGADLFLFENDYLNRQYVKRDAFILTGTDSDAYRDARQLDAAFLLLRNGPAARNFVAQWLELCCDPRIVTDAPNSCGAADLPGFVAHRHDQSVLSLLFLRERSRLRYALYPRSLKHRFIVHHRRRTPAVPIWLWHLCHDGAESFIRRMAHVDLRQAQR